MTSLAKLTSATKRAAVMGMLLSMPLLPVAACGDGGDGDGGEGGGGDVENSDTQEEDDGGVY